MWSKEATHLEGNLHTTGQIVVSLRTGRYSDSPLKWVKQKTRSSLQLDSVCGAVFKFTTTSGKLEANPHVYLLERWKPKIARGFPPLLRRATAALLACLPGCLADSAVRAATKVP